MVFSVPNMIKALLWKVQSLVGTQNIQVALSISFGWFVLGSLWTEQVQRILSKTDLAESSLCECPSIECPPCNKDIDNPVKKRIKNSEVSDSYYRTFSHTPLSSFEDETNRWRVLTKKYIYEMTNQEPRIGINGMWRLEVEQVDDKAQSLMKEHDLKYNLGTGKLDLKYIYRHSDPYYGVTYIADYLEKDEQSGKETHSSVEMWRPFIGGAPKLIDIRHADGKEIVNIISPLSKVTDRFRLFLERYETNILHNPLSGPVRIIFVLFHEGSDDVSANHAAKLLDEFKNRNPDALIDQTNTKGAFNRAVGLHAGVQKCNDDEIVLFLDVDLVLSAEFLARVRRNTIRSKRVIFPRVFSQYDPDVMENAAKLDPDLHPLIDDKMTINKETGLFIYYAFGIAAMYKSDYLKVGGFRLDIEGWGGEDVDLFKKMVADQDLDVMTMVDPDLIHVYHKRGCDTSLAPDQYAMCVGAWSETLGSQRQIANLYLDSHVRHET